MKKLFFFAAIAALVLSSCTTFEEVFDAEDSSLTKGPTPRPPLFIDSDIPANCYIVAPYVGQTTLSFPAVTRVNEYWKTGGNANTYPYGHTNHSNAISGLDQWYAEVIWADFDYTGKVSFIQNNGSPGFGIITKLEVILKNVNVGNIIVGLKKKNLKGPSTDYLWSWHIWISDVSPNPTGATSMGQTFVAPSGLEVMDRNLGALSATPDGDNTKTFGLYYQWGRKDPFPTAGATSGSTESMIWRYYQKPGYGNYGTPGFGSKLEKQSGSIDESVANPLTFYGAGSVDWIASGGNGSGAMNRWNNTSDGITKGAKTIFDPCPPGWRIPWGTNWSGFTATNFTNISSPIVGREFTGGFFFPASGIRRNSSGTLSAVSTYGHYWSASPHNATIGCNLIFNNASAVNPSNISSRPAGFSVRPVKDIVISIKEDDRTDVSNCYIVAPNRTHNVKLSFPAVTRVNEYWANGNSDFRGYGHDNHANAISGHDKWYAEVIWADFDHRGKVSITQSSGNPGIGTDTKLEIVLDKVNTQGNVIIGLKKYGSSNYLWSWHIWITDFTDTSTKRFTSPSGMITMDRNLGALSAKSDGRNTKTFGLMYQWGRKDPFPTAGATSGTTEPIIYNVTGNSGRYGANAFGRKASASGSIDESIYDPWLFFGAGSRDWVTSGTEVREERNRWNYFSASWPTCVPPPNPLAKYDKSIFDPCPTGWRLPWGSNWSGFTATNLTNVSSPVIGRQFAGGFFLPASGFRNSSTGNLTGVANAGDYWSGSPSSETNGHELYFTTSSVSSSSSDSRSCAYSVRPVKESSIATKESERNDVSNCYIVAPSTTHRVKLKFPVVTRVNQYWKTGGSFYGHNNHSNAIGSSDKWYAEVIWADFDHTHLISITQNSDNPATGTATKLEVVLGIGRTSGNIIVGLKKVGGTNYLWSWHIWITHFTGGAGQTFESPSGKIVMDRNLGARSPLLNPATTQEFGLYYQWGRKDPFPAAGDYNSNTESWINNPAGDSGQYGTTGFGRKLRVSGSIDASVANPLTFYGAGGVRDWVTSGSKGYQALNRWNNSNDGISKGTKTIYDPCPTGWRMPWGENWSGFTADNFQWDTYPVAGRRFTGDFFFPATGYRRFDSGALQNVGTYGYCWSGTPWYATAGYCLEFYSNAVSPQSAYGRSQGFVVRPVEDDRRLQVSVVHDDLIPTQKKQTNN